MALWQLSSWVSCLPGQLSPWGSCLTLAVVPLGQLYIWGSCPSGAVVYLGRCCLGSCPLGRVSDVYTEENWQHSLFKHLSFLLSMSFWLLFYLKRCTLYKCNTAKNTSSLYLFCTCWIWHSSSWWKTKVLVEWNAWFEISRCYFLVLSFGVPHLHL